jgi:hypothetical protein
MIMPCGLLADPPPPPQPTLNTTIVRSGQTNRQLRDRKKKTEAMNGSSPDQVTWFPGGRKVTIYNASRPPSGEVRDYLRLKGMMQKVKT